MRAVVVLWLLAGCYQPEVRDCVVPCTEGVACAGGQVCGTDGLCAAPEIAGRCAALLDAGAGDEPDAASDPELDAAPPDAAPSPCDLGCPDGTCVDGVCVIDCGPGACDDRVHCADDIPCRVRCGDGACAGGVDCHEATVCEVECHGLDSCAGEIRCHHGACDVTCSGEGACHNTIKCKDACACDVACTGARSCDGGSECPADACDVAAGCTSSLAGCDECA